MGMISFCLENPTSKSSTAMIEKKYLVLYLSELVCHAVVASKDLDIYFITTLKDCQLLFSL
jgi:hypothetical protein